MTFLFFFSSRQKDIKKHSCPRSPCISLMYHAMYFTDFFFKTLLSPPVFWECLNPSCWASGNCWKWWAAQTSRISTVSRRRHKIIHRRAFHLWNQVFSKAMTANIHLLISHGDLYLRWNIFIKLNISDFMFEKKVGTRGYWSCLGSPDRGKHWKMQSRCEEDTLKVRSQGLHAEYPHQHYHTVLLGSGPTFALWSNCAAGGLLEIGL